jgi:hypothetical protein
VKTKTFSITINGERWRYRALPEAEYQTRYGDLRESIAVTHKKERRMDFLDTGLTRGVVIHELIHAYCKGLYLGSTEIHWSDMEEIVCEMLEEKLDLIADQATQMHQKMTAHLASKSDSKYTPSVDEIHK